MNQQRYSRSPVPRRAGLPQPTHSHVYSDMVDADDYEEEYDDPWPTRMPRSAIRYTTTQEAAPVITAGNRRYVLHNRLPQPPQQNIPQPRPASRPQPQLQPRPQPQVRRVAPPPPQPEYDDEMDEPQPRPRRRLRVHPLVILGFGMVAMLFLWILGNMALNWWNTTQDDWHYGRPRTFQVDMVVGHNDSASNPSHFVAMNYRSHVEIIEFPGGDVTKARLYQGPTLYGDSQDLTAVTLSFRDITGNGKLDMILSVGSVHVAFINDNGQFRLLKPGERVSQY